MMHQYREKTSIERSRRLRRDSTYYEKQLWEKIMKRQCGNFYFRRQHAIGPYIVDFACIEKRWALEVDGYSHDFTQERDPARTAYLEKQGWRIMRVANEDIKTNLEGVYQQIESFLQS